LNSGTYSLAELTGLPEVWQYAIEIVNVKAKFSKPLNGKQSQMNIRGIEECAVV
jgi:hypothetical protein